ncbi:hypothetical protein PO124_10100 [Bacillus licheniformis]|nr:hypothetical protein [Bacillus licheniformis]
MIILKNNGDRTFSAFIHHCLYVFHLMAEPFDSRNAEEIILKQAGDSENGQHQRQAQHSRPA